MKLFPSLENIKNKPIEDEKTISVKFRKDWSEYVTDIINGTIPFNLEYFEFNKYYILKDIDISLLIKLSEKIAKNKDIMKDIFRYKYNFSLEMKGIINTGIHKLLLESNDKELISYSKNINIQEIIFEKILGDEYQGALFATGTCRLYDKFDNTKYLYDFINDYQKELSISDIITLISSSSVPVNYVLIHGLKQQEKDNINSRRFTSAIVSILGAISTLQIIDLLYFLGYQKDHQYRFDLTDPNSYEKEDTFNRVSNAISLINENGTIEEK